MAVSDDVQLGQNVKIFHPELVNLYGCRIGDETKIGTFVEIQKNVVVGARVKISSHTFICEGVKIEDEVFIGHGVTFTNDIYPRATNEYGSMKNDNDWETLKTLIYTGAVRKIRELLINNELGNIYYYDSVRINLGLFRHDVNVIWDLAVHDLAIMDYLLDSKPVAVSAIGMSHIPDMLENISYLTLFFASNSIAHVHVNWLAPVKIRRTLIGGDRKMIVYDELEPTEKIKVYDKGITLTNNVENIYQMLVDYRLGDMWVPHVDITEALRTEVLHFIDCIKTKARPVSDGQTGLQVVRILEAATKSMQEQGKLVKIK